MGWSLAATTAAVTGSQQVGWTRRTARARRPPSEICSRGGERRGKRRMGMAQGGKAENKVAADDAAWVFNVVTSVGIIMVNNSLMATHSFGFATMLPRLHFATTALATVILRSLGYLEPSYLPLKELIKYVAFANVPVVGMNASLKWNNIYLYRIVILPFLIQISKLSTVPVLCILEVLYHNVRYSRGTKLSIIVVLVGVAVCNCWGSCFQYHVSAT